MAEVLEAQLQNLFACPRLRARSDAFGDTGSLAAICPAGERSADDFAGIAPLAQEIEPAPQRRHRICRKQLFKVTRKQKLRAAHRHGSLGCG